MKQAMLHYSIIEEETYTDELVELIKDAIEALPMEIPTEDKPLRGLIDRLVYGEQGVIMGAYNDNEVVGVIAGMVYPDHPIIQGKTIASELVLFVKDGYRTKPSIVKTLIEGFEFWGTSIQGADYIDMSAYQNKAMSRIYGRYGFKEFETHYIKKVK